MVGAMQRKYGDYYQQMLIAHGKAIEFYKKYGFEKAIKILSIWIYQGNDH